MRMVLQVNLFFRHVNGVINGNCYEGKRIVISDVNKTLNRQGRRTVTAT